MQTLYKLPSSDAAFCLLGRVMPSGEAVGKKFQEGSSDSSHTYTHTKKSSHTHTLVLA